VKRNEARRQLAPARNSAAGATKSKTHSHNPNSPKGDANLPRKGTPPPCEVKVRSFVLTAMRLGDSRAVVKSYWRVVSRLLHEAVKGQIGRIAPSASSWRPILPFAPDCELSIPLERLRLETPRLALPPLALPWQISKAAAPFRFLVCPLIRDPFTPRGRPAQTLHSTHGFRNFQASRMTRVSHASCSPVIPA
jgi:hypothetical protein